MTLTIETLDGIRIDRKDVAETGIFEGYGAVFGNIDDDRDRIDPGAFNATLAEHKEAGTKPALLWQHDTRQPIGVFTDIKEDRRGLFVRGQLAGQGKGAEARELLAMGALDGLSVGFRTIKAAMDEQTGARVIQEVELMEVSIVTFPANGRARVTRVKDAINSIRSFEAFLRDAGGYSRAEARRIAEHGFKALGSRDEDAVTSMVARINQATATLSS